MNFGEYIQNRMLVGQWDREGVAAQLSIDPATVTTWTNNRRRPSREHMIEVIDLLSMDPALALRLAAKPLEGTAPAKENT